MTTTIQNKLRDEVCDMSGYYNEVSHAFYRIKSALKRYDIECGEMFGVYSDEGRVHIRLERGSEDVENVVVFGWYRMPSYRWEITTYIS